MYIVHNVVLIISGQYSSWKSMVKVNQLIKTSSPTYVLPPPLLIDTRYRLVQCSSRCTTVCHYVLLGMNKRIPMHRIRTKCVAYAELQQYATNAKLASDAKLRKRMRSWCRRRRYFCWYSSTVLRRKDTQTNASLLPPPPPPPLPPPLLPPQQPLYSSTVLWRKDTQTNASLLPPLLLQQYCSLTQRYANECVAAAAAATLLLSTISAQYRQKISKPGSLYKISGSFELVSHSISLLSSELQFYLR